MLSAGHSRPALALLAFGTLLLTSSCTNKAGNAEPNATSAAQSEPTIVPVTKVVRSNLASNLVVTGEFIPYQEIDVMAKEAGYIKSIRVDIGDRVHTGQLLADLEIPEMRDDIARASAGVQAAEAEITAARGDLSRAQSTYDIAELSYKRILDVSKKEPGLVPQQEVDVAHSKELETAAQVSSAKSNLETTQRKVTMAQADESRWKTMQEYTVITAPFTGVITKRYANTGAMIQQGTASQSQAMPVVRLSQNNLLRLIVPVPESAVSTVHVGATVEVSVPALQKTIPGRITRFEDKLSMSTRTMDTEIDVPNPDYTLMPGMHAEVNLRLQQMREVLAVPVDAVEEAGDVSQVYKVQDSTIHIVPVKLGIKTSQQQEVRSGLQEDDLVIVGRHAGFQDGQKVQPKLVHFDDPSTSTQGS